MRGDPADQPETTRPRGDVWLGIALITVALVVMVLAPSIRAMGVGENSDPGPRAFPLAMAVLLAGGGAVEIWRSRGGKRTVGVERDRDETRRAVRLAVPLLGALALYVLLLPWLGFAVATLLMATAMMIVLGNRWWHALVISVVMVGVVYVLFVLVFKVPLPGGVFDLPF